MSAEPIDWIECATCGRPFPGSHSYKGHLHDCRGGTVGGDDA